VGYVSFSEILPQIRKGRAGDEISESLQRVVAAVAKTSKSGSLTLTLKVSREGENEVAIEYDLRDKVPIERGVALFFTDEDGNLTRRNPRQMVLPNTREEEVEAD